MCGVTRPWSTAIAVAAAATVGVVGAAAAVGAGPMTASGSAPAKTLPGPTDPFPTASIATTSTTTTTPVTIVVSTLPPGTVQLTDATRRIRVNVPNTWTDRATSPGVADDGGQRPTLSAATDAAAFRNTWTAPGLWMVAVDPGIEPSTLLDNNSFVASCQDNGVETFSNAHVIGLQERWSDCGDRPTQLLVVSGRTPDNSATLLLQLQTLTPDDPAVELVLGSFGVVPGSGPPPPVAPSQPPVAGDVPSSLIHAAASPDAQLLHDGSDRLTVAVPSDWTDVDRESRLNDDYTRRPFIEVAPSRADYEDGWDGAGLVVQVLPYHDPSVPLTSWGYADTCTDAGIQMYRRGELRGYVQTWTSCGGTDTRAVVLAASDIDRTSTVVLEVHLPDADNAPLALALSSLELA
jgi:hypothetical protein